MQKPDPVAINKRLQKALIAHRKEQGITQVELAEKLGKPQSFVSKYETGERKLTVGDFLLVARILKTDAALILSEIDSK